MYLKFLNIHQSNKIPDRRNSSISNVLIMFDNDMNISNRSHLFNSYLKMYIICNGIINYGFELSKNVSLYKENLIKNVNKLIPKANIIKSIDLKIFLSDYKSIDVIYPGFGHNLDLINKYGNQNKIKINYIYRDQDLIYWKYAKSGFYKFKNSFYNLNNI